jgi:putative transposase
VLQAIPIVLSDEERTTLATWSRSRTMPARLVTRARIVLLASEGADNSRIARELGINRLTVKLWRSQVGCIAV